MKKKQSIKVIIDTDIGGDIDDVLALAIALNSPEIELKAVTTVNTDPFIRARIAAKMLKVFNKAQIPVAAGEKRMFDGSSTKCKDINGAVVLTLKDPVPERNGVDLMIETVKKNPEEIVIIGIGCWTNIAKAFSKAPDIMNKVKKLVLMGGKVYSPKPESNVICDPSAASYIFNLSVPKMLVPLDVTSQCRYRIENHGQLIKKGEDTTNFIFDSLRAWQIGRNNGNPKAEPILHDPLAVALSFEDSFINKIEPLHLELDYNDKYEKALTIPKKNKEPNINVVTSIKKEEFESFFAKRILG
ncbi:MAG: nucleoside hydrolase [Candidatus Woesearchaeota archaeon]